MVFLLLQKTFSANPSYPDIWVVIMCLMHLKSSRAESSLVEKPYGKKIEKYSPLPLFSLCRIFSQKHLEILESIKFYHYPL